MLEVEQPIVSAVHGYAFGIGATLALCAATSSIAADDAVFADTHVGIGLVAGDGGTLMWPLLLPVNTAKYYLMTGDRITGADAERLGLVVKAVPAAELDAAAHEIAARLAAGPTLAIKFTKMAVNKAIRERANLVFETSLLLEGLDPPQRGPSGSDGVVRREAEAGIPWPRVSRRRVGPRGRRTRGTSTGSSAASCGSTAAMTARRRSSRPECSVRAAGATNAPVRGERRTRDRVLVDRGHPARRAVVLRVPRRSRSRASA